MTPCVIAAVWLNRRAPDSWRLPNGRLHAPDCASSRSWTHRAAHPMLLVRVWWPRYCSMPDCATVLGACEKSSGKSRFHRCAVTDAAR
jgi:hypothetical protein